MQARRKGRAMTKLSIPDMSCNHCKMAVEAAIASVPGAGMAQVDLASRTALVPDSAPLPDVFAALERAGYPARVAG
jgi:copper chaperone